MVRKALMPIGIQHMELKEPPQTTYPIYERG
jgi:hypothetical protein